MADVSGDNKMNIRRGPLGLPPDIQLKIVTTKNMRISGLCLCLANCMDYWLILFKYLQHKYELLNLKKPKIVSLIERQLVTRSDIVGIIVHESR